MLDVRVCGGVEVEIDGRVLPDSLVGGRQGRLVLAYLVCERDRVVRREELADLLWPGQLPESWTASLSAVISRLRRLFGEAGLDGQAVITSTPGAYQLMLPAASRVDLEDLTAAVASAEDAAASGDVDRAVAAAADAEAVAGRGFLADDCEWVDARRESVRGLRVRAAIAQSAAHLGAGAAGRAIDAARRALDLDPAKEAAYRQLMRALAAAGERGEALRVWERCRITLVEELGIDPSPETEAVYLQLLDARQAPATKELPSGVVTFLLTDIVESSALWEDAPDAMAKALERHDAIVGEIVAAHDGTLLKSKLEGDATVSVFARATGATIAALALLDALAAEAWPEGAAPRLRMAMHTGEAFERGGDYFGPALNRAARLRGLAGADEVLLSQAVTELVRDHLPPDVMLLDRGHRNLRGLSRGENVFQLVKSRAGDARTAAHPDERAITQPPVPAVLAGAGPFVGRKDELSELIAHWDRCVAGNPCAALVGGEPGVGKSRLAGEIAQHAYATGALVLYGRCDEDLAAPLQPFIEAFRILAPALGAARLRAIRGIDELTRVIPEVSDLLPEAAPAVRADPDTERLALFDAVTQLLAGASREAPVLLVLDDLHWAGKTTLSLLRHVLRGAKESRLLVVGTYRDTELARTHPLAATLADLRRDSDTHRISLGGLAAADVEQYLAAIGNTDRALGRELAEITSGNPFFLIEVVRHVEESGGEWQPGTLPEGVREATGRRLSRLTDALNDALAVAAVVGTTFDLALVENVQGKELVDPIAEACQAGLVIEESGSLGRFRFAHAIVRQVLLAELVSLKRVRLHRTIAELLEASPPAADADVRLADLAYHWFECASAGSADRAVAACRRAADRAMERVAYEEAGDLYGMAIQALEWIDDADPDIRAALHLARCDALLTAGDVAGARSAIDALELASAGSERLAAWYTTYEGLLAVLAEPDRLTEIVRSIGAAAGAMRAVGDLTGEAKAHYVHASALERLGQIGSAERALDAALAAARSADDRRLADAILAEAPPAALWGPSPVTRASGRCLDVVRVLRITSGAPAVEAVALRCQAVLEALRGRMDAAHRMIRSAGRTVEQLGLTHRRLETEVAAGFIELLDGDAAAAEQHLRIAYDELRERGLGGEAAQAGAFLGRALLMQGRVDDADDVAAVAETLAGSDLKAAIAWRGVRAEVAARRGDTEHALALAREAVDLATATDALLLIVDARLALATVLRTAGDTVAADAEAQRAAEACDLKGAIVLAARARVGLRPEPVQQMAAARADAVRELEPSDNLAYAYSVGFQEAFNRADWPAMNAMSAPGFVRDDRRHYVAHTVGEEDQFSHQFAHGNEGQFEPPELIATRGRYLALCRCLMRGPDWEAPYLSVVRVDELGLCTDYMLFEPDAMDDAVAAFDEFAAATPDATLTTPAPFENDVTRSTARVHAAHRAHDWDALLACYADAWIQDDRRSVVAGPLNHEQSLAGIRMIFDGRGWIESETIAARGRSLAVARSTLRIPAHDAIASVLGVTRTDDTGRQELTVLFDADDLDGAMAELERLYREGEGAERFANPAWRAALRFRDACNRRDWQRILDTLTDDFGVVDHRQSVLLRFEGDEALDVFRVMQALDQFTWEGTLLATRGDHLALSIDRVSFLDGAAGPAEVENIALVECTPQGLIVSHTAFNPEDLDVAYDALDTRYVELGGIDLRPYRDVFNSQDWGRFTAFLAEDAVIDDRRLGGYGRVDRESYVAYERAILEIGPDVTYKPYFDHVDASTPHASLFVGRIGGTRDGGPFEMPLVALGQFDAEGRITALTTFDMDDLDTARAEYARLTQPPVVDRFENAATRAAQRFQEQQNAQDWQAFLATVPPDLVCQDRRPGFARDYVGEDALSFYQAAFRLDEVRLDREVVATRGESLALERSVARFRDGVAGPAEVACLGVIETDAQGRVATQVLFDVDDITGAFDELDARYVELGGADMRAARDAFNSRDWERYAAFLPEDAAIDDRRTTTGYGQLDRDGFVAYERTILDVAPDVTLRIDHVVAETRATLVVGAISGTHEGGPFEVPYISLGQSAPDGRTTAITFFDIDDLGAARAEYERLTKPSRVDVFENAATRAARRLHDAMHAKDWHAFVTRLAPNFEYSDRRAGLATDYIGENALAAHRIAFEIDEVRNVRHIVATRGESLALYHVLTTIRDGASGPAEMEGLGVIEVGADDRVVAQVLFDADDMTGAVDELDARYVELGGLDARAAREAFNTRDWDRYASFLPEDGSMDDRRTVGYGLLDREGFMAYELSMLEMAPDVMLRVDHLRETPTATLVVGAYTGTQDGGPFEIPYLTLAKFAPDGRCIAIVEFDIDDLDTACAEYDRLTRPLVVDLFENDATRASRRHVDVSNAQNWQAFLATVSPDFTFHDRRAGLAMDCTGEDALAFVCISYDLDEFRLDRELIATRGESLALSRAVTSFSDGVSGPSEIECLGIDEADDQGRLAATVLFDIDDITSALDELDARYVALGGSPYSATIRQSFAARDWDTLASLLTPDCTFVDSRTAGWGLVDRDAFVDYQRSVVELAPDAQLWTDHARSRGNVHISTGRAFGTRIGGPWEIAFVTVAVTQDDGRATHVETYELTDMARAQERFAELAALEAEADPRENLAWQAAERQATSVNTGDWESFADTFAPDSVADDRRSGIALVLRGEEVLSTHRVLFTLDQKRLTQHLVATRGDRLALAHATVMFEDGEAGPAEVTYLNLFQVDPLGRVTHMISFNADDRAGAHDELDARAAALAVESDPLTIPRNRAVRTVQQDGWTLISAFDDNLCLHATPDGFVVHDVDASGTVAAQIDCAGDDRRGAANEIARRFHEQHSVPTVAAAMTTSLNARDLAGARDALADSCVVEDHRQLRVVAFHSADEWLEIMASTLALVPDYLCEVLRCVAAEPWGQAVLTRISGTTGDGAPFESLYVTLSLWDRDGRAVHLGIFDPEDATDAVARLRELAP